MSSNKPSFFTRFSKEVAHAAGRPLTFIIALAVIIVWGVSGPLFGFSDTWQLIINTSTTIITFLMVFLIQNTQNRDSQAVQLKLDELICALKEADNRLLDVEDLDDKEMEQRRDEMVQLAKQADDVANEIGRAETAKKKK